MKSNKVGARALDAGDIGSKLFDALEPLPFADRLSIPLSVFIETALENGVSVAEVVDMTKEAADEYARRLELDGIEVTR